MKVAVVIPLYNQARYIGAALESLRVQSRRPDRVIIIDDGSTDGGLNAVIAYSESIPVELVGTAAGPETYTDVLVQAHAGVQAVVNRAVVLADDCDCVAILNADDCYHPQRIERCLEYLQGHPAVDLVCTRLRLIDEAGSTLSADTPRARWFANVWSFRAASDDQGALDLPGWLGLANFAGTTSNFFARTAYLREHPLSAAYPGAHDYHALVLAALDNRLGVIDSELLDHRVVPSDHGPGDAEAMVRETLRINVDLARQLAPRLATEPELRRAFTSYQRSAWSNVGTFRADLFNLLLVEALALLPSKAADALLAGLDTGRFPEVGQLPGCGGTAGTRSPAALALGPTGGLADRFLGLKAQLSAARASARTWTEYRQIQAAVLESRWFALGRLLGLTRSIHAGGGKTGAEKLALLRERLLASRWLRLGRWIGSPSATRLRLLGAAITDDWRG